MYTMPTPAPHSNGGRWCDIEGTPIVVFCPVDQVADRRGRVVGRGLDSVAVCFPGNQVISVAPQLLHVLDHATPGGE